jgi:gluconolactonase
MSVETVTEVGAALQAEAGASKQQQIAMRRGFGTLGIVIAFIFCYATSSVRLSAQAKPASEISDEAAKGQELFSSTCSACHGLDGRGGEHAVNIATNATVQHLTDSDLAHIIRNGIRSAGMPAFGASFDDGQIDYLVQYVRVLQGQAGAVSVPGDPNRGRALFFGTAGCSNCHMVNGKGGFLAADLSSYGETHASAEVREAIVNPNKNLEPQNGTVVVTTRAGRKYTGLARNEDNFSLQLQTADGSFHSLDKSDLAQIVHQPQSMMPSDYGSQLSKANLDDLVAFLIKRPAMHTTGVEKEASPFELAALSPRFWELFDRQAKLTTVASGFGFTEGPVWDAAGFLYVSDEEQNKIYRVYPDGRKESVIALGDPDGNTFDQQQRLLDCASVLRALIRVSPNGHYTVLADRFQGHRFNSPNDIVIGPDGAVYFTDPTLDLPKGENQEIPFQGVYRLGEQGDVRLLEKDMSQPNGLAFSPDGKRLYVDDSEQKNIRVFDFSADASVSNNRIFGNENEPGGVPDGMKVDESGNLYVVGPKGIWVWDPQGNHLGTVILPEQPANLAWGDEDYGTLYITATKSVYRIRTKARGFMPNLPKRSSQH